MPLCDGHDSAIMTINQELVRRGAEVVYLGYHQSASAIARAAIQEDVHAVGISSYNGGHRAFFREVIAQLRVRGRPDIPVFGGGGGTISTADARVMQRDGVDRIFFAGTPLDSMLAEIESYWRPAKPQARWAADAALGRSISLMEGAARATKRRSAARSTKAPAGRSAPFVIGVAGPGGAGKSTLIDELTSFYLRLQPGGRVAILANDPSHADSGGALLGDRVAAIYAQNDRVFFRSLATRGSMTGISAAVPAVLATLRQPRELAKSRRAGGRSPTHRRSQDFDLVFVESVGIGQESDPFRVLGRGPRWVDAMLFVLSPHYGGRIQLEKIGLLRHADIVVLNKCDDPRTATAKTELGAVLAPAGRERSLYLTTAARHNDTGVAALYAAIAELAGLETGGGEKPCQLDVHGI